MGHRAWGKGLGVEGRGKRIYACVKELFLNSLRYARCALP